VPKACRGDIDPCMAFLWSARGPTGLDEAEARWIIAMWATSANGGLTSALNSAMTDRDCKIMDCCGQTTSLAAAYRQACLSWQPGCGAPFA
jgi:hypothetical protein